MIVANNRPFPKAFVYLPTASYNNEALTFHYKFSFIHASLINDTFSTFALMRLIDNTNLLILKSQIAPWQKKGENPVHHGR